MAISRARKRFRVFLGVTLALSLAFFSTTTLIYIGLKNKTISMAQIAPTLFQIDILKDQAIASISSDDEKLKIGASLYQKGLFSSLYAHAGEEMIQDLADKGHAKAQTIYGDMIYFVYNRTRMNGERLSVANEYYRKAAEQGYEPARQRLADVSYRATIAMADALRP